MTRPLAKTLLWAMVLVLLAGTIRAQAAPDAEKCANPGSMSPDLRINYCTKAIRSGQLSNENLAITFDNRGSAYLDNGDYERAIPDFTQAIKLDPNFAAAYNDRGFAYQDQGKNDLAVADYSRAISVDPKYADAYVNRGGIYVTEGRYKQALTDLNQAIALDPKMAKAYYNLGVLYRDRESYPWALVNYSRAIALDPGLSDAYLGRGLIYSDLGNYTKAITEYSAAIRIEPGSLKAIIDRANAYVNLGDYDGAMADYGRALQLRPNFIWVFRYRALARFRQGRFDLAAEDFARAVQQEPTDPYGVLWLYLAQAHAGQNGAKTLAANARQLDLSQWPGPVVLLYLGAATAATVQKAADNADAGKRASEQCEAAFYTGEHFLLRGEKAQAADNFRKARDSCSVSSVESDVAKAELARLQG